MTETAQPAPAQQAEAPESESCIVKFFKGLVRHFRIIVVITAVGLVVFAVFSLLYISSDIFVSIFLSIYFLYAFFSYLME